MQWHAILILNSTIVYSILYLLCRWYICLQTQKIWHWEIVAFMQIFQLLFYNISRIESLLMWLINHICWFILLLESELRNLLWMLPIYVYEKTQTNTLKCSNMQTFYHYNLRSDSRIYYLPSGALSRAMTASSNLIISVVPLCQWTVTLAGKPLWVNIASTMPPVNAAQFKVLFSLGTDM